MFGVDLMLHTRAGRRFLAASEWKSVMKEGKERNLYRKIRPNIKEEVKD